MKNILLLSFFVTISTWAQKKHIIEVRAGERVSDLISRLEDKSILSKDAVEQILNVWTVTFKTLETSFRVKYSVSSPVIDNLFKGFPMVRIPVAREVAPQV